ncbi:hypothetical protein KKF61_08310, partial [Patescibacteria group bacterium]|nr:hypothetical protein [Patescibacteria group bacterium]
LWTDYTFGSGMTWQTDEENAKKALDSFWDSENNKAVLSARGQRKSSDKLLVDGEVFFAIFLGAHGEAKIRRIDPLEITEIITDPDDIEDVRFYRRDWADRQGKTQISIYRSTTNIKGEPALDSMGANVKQTDEALVYHLTNRTLGQRGTPLLLPAHFYLKYNKKFIASRIAIMLALTRFGWRTEVKGGQAAVDKIKAKTNEQVVSAGSHLVENLGSNTTPIKAETGASSAYQDGRMIKLMIASAVGIPEQYFEDISIGNLATAKTVELPMMKQFRSLQKVWADAYQDIANVIMQHNAIPKEQWYVDIDFPEIAPQDTAAAAEAMVKIVGLIPEFADASEVQQQALMLLGINDPAEVIDSLGEGTSGNKEALLIKVLKQFRESLETERGE